MNDRFNFFKQAILLVCIVCLSNVSTEAAWPDPEALVREAFQASEKPVQQADLEKYLHFHRTETLVRQGRLDEALEYAQKHEISKGFPERRARLFVDSLIDRGRFDEAVEFARSVPPDQNGNGPSQLLRAISFRQAQCGRFDDARKTLSFLPGNRKRPDTGTAKSAEECRCLLLKDGKALRNVDGTLNDESTTFSIFRFCHASAVNPKKPLLNQLFYAEDYTDDLVAAIEASKKKKNDEAKTLFEKVIGKHDYIGNYTSGTRTEGERRCGIAVIQFELGHPDWAAQTLARIHFPEEKDWLPAHQDQVRLGHAVTDVQVLLGDLDGAEQMLQRFFSIDGDDPPSVCTTAWAAFARHLISIGKQDEAVVILKRILGRIKTLEHHFSLRDTVEAVLSAVRELKDETTKKEIANRVRRYVDMRNERYYSETYFTVIRYFAQERMFTEAVRFMRPDSPPYHRTEALLCLTEAAYEAGSIEALKQVRGETFNDFASRVLISRRIARLAFEAGDMEEAEREIELAIGLARNVHFHRFFEQHASMLDIAEDIRFFQKTKPN